jgi:hypothetical protein
MLMHCHIHDWPQIDRSGSTNHERLKHAYSQVLMS